MTPIPNRKTAGKVFGYTSEPDPRLQCVRAADLHQIPPIRAQHRSHLNLFARLPPYLRLQTIKMTCRNRKGLWELFTVMVTAGWTTITAVILTRWGSLWNSGDGEFVHETN
jgi:hypothetical protein